VGGAEGSLLKRFSFHFSYNEEKNEEKKMEKEMKKSEPLQRRRKRRRRRRRSRSGEVRRASGPSLLPIASPYSQILYNY